MRARANAFKLTTLAPTGTAAKRLPLGHAAKMVRALQPRHHQKHVDNARNRCNEVSRMSPSILSHRKEAQTQGLKKAKMLLIAAPGSKAMCCPGCWQLRLRLRLLLQHQHHQASLPHPARSYQEFSTSQVRKPPKLGLWYLAVGMTCWRCKVRACNPGSMAITSDLNSTKPREIYL